MKDNKRNIINNLKLHKRDTGSADVQIVALTQKLQTLRNKYVESGRSEAKYRKEMLVNLNKRQGLIDYLKLTDTVRYQNISEVLNINWL